jgi:hypothetical protein
MVDFLFVINGGVFISGGCHNILQPLKIHFLKKVYQKSRLFGTTFKKGCMRFQNDLHWTDTIPSF